MQTQPQSCFAPPGYRSNKHVTFASAPIIYSSAPFLMKDLDDDYSDDIEDTDETEDIDEKSFQNYGIRNLGNRFSNFFSLKSTNNSSFFASATFLGIFLLLFYAILTKSDFHFINLTTAGRNLGFGPFYFMNAFFGMNS